MYVRDVKKVVAPILAAAPKNDKYAAAGEMGPWVSSVFIEALKCHPRERHHSQHRDHSLCVHRWGVGKVTLLAAAPINDKYAAPGEGGIR